MRTGDQVRAGGKARTYVLATIAASFQPFPCRDRGQELGRYQLPSNDATPYPEEADPSVYAKVDTRLRVLRDHAQYIRTPPSSRLEVNVAGKHGFDAVPF